MPILTCRRGEVFNANNTPPLGSPNDTFGSAAFGTMTTAVIRACFRLQSD